MRSGKWGYKVPLYLCIFRSWSCTAMELLDADAGQVKCEDPDSHNSLLSLRYAFSVVAEITRPKCTARGKPPRLTKYAVTQRDIDLAGRTLYPVFIDPPRSTRLSARKTTSSLYCRKGPRSAVQRSLSFEMTKSLLNSYGGAHGFQDVCTGAVPVSRVASRSQA